MRRVLVTGATGGLGYNAALYAHEQDLFVRATGRNARALSRLEEQGIETCRLDLEQASEGALAQLVSGCDTIWHCAALATPWGKKEDFHRINVLASEALYRAATQERCKTFVFISTPSIYFDYCPRRGIQEAFRPAKFVNDYARTKAQAELMLNTLSSRAGAPRLVHLRPRAIFGPHDQVLFPRLMKLIESRKGVLPLPDGGSARLDMTYVDNVVHAMDLASRVQTPSGRAYNISNGEPVVLREMLEMLFARMGRPLRIQSMPYPALDLAARMSEAAACITGKEPSLTRYGIGALALEMTLDISRARQELGYAPIVSMQEAVQRTASWILAHG